MQTPDALLIPDTRWFLAPPERTQSFLVVFAQVARALQLTLREVMPAIAFQDPAAYDETELAYPMLAYRASRPYSCRQRTEFAYDVLNPERVATFFYHVRRNLPAVVRRTRAALIADGRPDQAEQYSADMLPRILKVVRKHKKHRHALDQMLVMEGRLFDELVELGAARPGSPKDREKAIARFNKEWSSLLRRFCGSRDFTAAGPALLQAATDAFVNAAPSRQFDSLAA